MFAIRAENLSKTYRASIFAGELFQRERTEALRDLSLEVRPGEIFGFLGPNGAGKTTTIHLLLNLIRPSKGAAFLFGIPVTDAEIHARIGYLPESVNLHEYYTGRALLEFYAALGRIPRHARSGLVTQALLRLGLQDAADKPVSKYSKGMLQRIGLAQAMLHDPDLLILDEPTSSLDPVGRKEFREILLDLKSRGKTIFISSHILSEVETICDRVAILEKGQLRRTGTMEELSRPSRIRIVVRNPPGQVLEALAATTATVTMSQGEVTIVCEEESLRLWLEELLARNRVEIARTEREKQSLEEIFFSAIHPGDPS